MATITDGESPDADLSELFDIIRMGQQRWVEGQPEGFDQHERMTIYGPFGGPARTFAGNDDPRQAAVRAQFQGGDATVEIVRTIRSGDTVVVVSLATCSVQFVDRADRHPWILRTTEVYERTEGNWRRLHRHADPLITPRPLAETLALLPSD